MESQSRRRPGRPIAFRTLVAELEELHDLVEQAYSGRMAGVLGSARYQLRKRALRTEALLCRLGRLPVVHHWPSAVSQPPKRRCSAHPG
jgi:hypothetical protein